jgi:hypothetical protein
MGIADEIWRALEGAGPVLGSVVLFLAIGTLIAYPAAIVGLIAAWRRDLVTGILGAVTAVSLTVLWVVLFTPALFFSDKPWMVLAAALLPWRSPAVAVILCPALLGLIAIRMAQARGAIPGHCTHCGYNLRGSQESRYCPECGKALTIEELEPA